jgi:hypothetical protein
MYDLCIEGVEMYRQRGADAPDTHSGVYFLLSLISKGSGQPGCEAKIRGLAKALGFCLENSLDMHSDMGMTSGAVAAQLCELAAI